VSTLDDFLASLQAAGVRRVVLELGDPPPRVEPTEDDEDAREIQKRRPALRPRNPFAPPIPGMKRDG